MALAAKTVTVDKVTRKAQSEASDPRASAWVAANAGSGKTFVLAQRVIRLLLAGSDPARILCLTFTRAAAAEMAKRVFDTLSGWATLPDAKLAAEIAKVEGRRPDPAILAGARRLFARALETPGGLKIQTIHAFCERLLHQFPFEANVAGHFEVLDERDAAALADAARRSVLARAARDPDGPLGEALRAVLAAASDTIHELAVKEFVDKRDRVRAWIVRAGSLDAALRELRGELGVGDGDTAARLHAAILDEGALVEDLGRLVVRLAESGSNDQKAAARLAPILDARSDAERCAAYLDFWLTGDGKLRANPVTRTVKDDWPGLAEWLEEERDRLVDLLDRVAAAECYESSAAMLRLADASIQEYDRVKTARGVLDFDDLIARTADLLGRADASRWVHYKLDRGLDHILMDEAQDTSPRQWEVVGALAEEFFAGEGAAQSVRTLFAVGDEKQSIYSFQGAVPAWFSRMRGELGGRARKAGFGWTDPELHLSFRSAGVILSAVDAVFSTEDAYRGLSGEPGPTVHSAARLNAPGQVILWPMIAPPEKPEPEDWTSPVDHLGEDSPEVKLANRIADTIDDWIKRAEPLESTGTAIRPGGILILTRTRGAQTDAINRALKTRGVPIAGADRLTLTEHIAVMDLMGLGRIMLLPEDDLSLAAVLKSPLIGLDEDQLFAIAHGRGKKTLWWALGEAAVRDEDGPFAAARARLDAWRARADYLDPYDFYGRILADEHNGRRQFLRRLGSEAEDVLDEFLAQALAYEQAHTPSLQGFLAFLDAAETQIRRDTDAVRDEVRVMTVHGAKGLEADIVFLVDVGSRPVHPNHDAKVVALEDDRDGEGHPLVWMRSSKLMPARVDRRVKALRADAEEEYRRLLYVAMTRARDRLYVCGTLKQTTDSKAGWHALVTSALEAEAVERELPGGSVELEWRPPPARAIPTRGKQEAMAFAPRQPDWLKRDAPPAPRPLHRITPSAAVSGPPGSVHRGPDAVETAVGGPDTALERGRLIHRLLQSLPEIEANRRADAGARYLDAVASDWPADLRAALLDEVLRVLDHPDFRPVFLAGSRAEIDIAGRLGTATIAGRIDRLAVTPDRVLIVDYKTNRPVPQGLDDTPHDYVIQLALYRTIVGRLYPDKSVAAAILWTDRPALMEIPSALLDAAASSISEALPVPNA